MKKCVNCHQEKEISQFYSHPTTRDRHARECKPCVKIRWNKSSTPDRKFGANLKRKYWKSLSWREALAEYNRRLEQQGGVCAICGLKEKKIMRGKVRSLSVDHCHKTGKIRALLCDACNVAEGLLKNSDNAEAMAAYMRVHQ